MKIYTKTGDKGMTSLVGGQRVMKCCERIESYGTVDELNSYIGLLLTFVTEDADRESLLRIQGELFSVGGYLATPSSGTHADSLVVDDDMISGLEQAIDRMETVLPPLRSFILPGGSRASAYAHVCRTVCRRAERCVHRLIESGAEVDSHVTAYINRLSDYFFVLARKLNVDEGTADTPWRRR